MIAPMTSRGYRGVWGAAYDAAVAQRDAPIYKAVYNDFDKKVVDRDDLSDVT